MIVYDEVDITSTCMVGKLQVPSTTLMSQRINVSWLLTYYNLVYNPVCYAIGLCVCVLGGGGEIFKIILCRQETNQLLNCSFLFNYVILTNYVI